jgi:plastocyanin
MNSRLKYLTVPLVAAAFVVGCGSDDDSSDTETATGTGTTTQTEQPAGDGNQAQTQVLRLQADPDGALAYVEDTLDAKPGLVAIEFTNDSPVAHDVVVEKGGEEVARSSIITSSSESISFEAGKGEYTYYCSLPGHREAGMEGTLTVR